MSIYHIIIYGTSSDSIIKTDRPWTCGCRHISIIKIIRKEEGYNGKTKKKKTHQQRKSCSITDHYSGDRSRNIFCNDKIWKNKLCISEQIHGRIHGKGK